MVVAVNGEYQALKVLNIYFKVRDLTLPILCTDMFIKTRIGTFVGLVIAVSSFDYLASNFQMTDP